uniref:Zgc:66426 n=1 Tax=Neogobius melanostomus TaxID=47308 RepID=A0A8C6TXN9_9GOBI
MDRLLNEEELQDLYAWIDKIPLSRPKRHITRDFSDGVMAAEVVKCYFPKLVDLHNYVPANSTAQKLSNWDLLNRKVFSKLEFHVTEDTVNKIVLSSAGAIEPVLSALREKLNPRPEQSDNALDLEYYDTRDQKKASEGNAISELSFSTFSPLFPLRDDFNKLEHLVRLKDIRIEELTRHLETYKAKGSNPK